MRVTFRVDAFTNIGIGHIMRCLTLGTEIHARGGEVAFIGRFSPSGVREMIASHGMPFYELPAVQSGTAGQCRSMGSMGEDADQTAAILGTLPPSDWLIVDHYDLDAKWEQRLRHHTRHLMVIDDVANRPHECDVLLDQNYYCEPYRRYAGLVSSDTSLLLGPKYALLREEFRKAAGKAPVRKRLGRVLVFFGGADPAGMTTKALHGLADAGLAGIHLDVVVGAANTARHAIEEECRKYDSASFHCQTDKMAELMLAADLAIGAGGTTHWERLATGLPALVVSIAANQEEVSRDLAGTGAIRYLGSAKTVSVEYLVREIRAIAANPDILQRMSLATRDVVDGKGVERVVTELEASYG